MAVHDPALANEIEHRLEQAPKSLIQFPRRGPRLAMFDRREIREYRFDRYVLRYEVADSDIIVLRFFHAREDRR